MYITALYGSPRKDGNTDQLMQSFLRGVREKGSVPHEIMLRDLHFSPCIECGACTTTGTCVLHDGMDSIYPHLLKSDVIILSAPVFFYGLNALAKAMVDRTQCFWAKKYLLGRKVRDSSTSLGKGILLSVGGSRGQKNFDGMLLTARYFFDALDMPLAQYLVFGSIDAKGSVLEHPTACSDAYNLGKSLCE